MLPVLSFGEALIDFVPLQKGQTLAGTDAFASLPGGAPANVAACIARLGGVARFAGQVGRDGFGDRIEQTLVQTGVDTRWLQRTTAAKTALAFVTLADSGERDFAFYRDPSADMLFPASAVQPHWFEEPGIFHFGTLSLTHETSGAATRKAVRLAREADWLVSFDPNARLELWPSADAFVAAAGSVLHLCDVVKVSEEELDLLGGATSSSPRCLLSRGVKVLLTTRGANGVRLTTSELDLSLPGQTVSVVDTTGAGDAFVGAWLYELARRRVTPSTLAEFLRERSIVLDCLSFANACAALTVTRRGAIPAMPLFAEVRAFVGAGSRSHEVKDHR